MGYGVILEHLSPTNTVEFEMFITSREQWERVQAAESQLVAQGQTITAAIVRSLGIQTRLPGASTWQNAESRIH